MPEFKRPADVRAVAIPEKRSRMELVEAGVGRTSQLQAPIMLLQGHEGEIYSAKFSPDGSCVASAGYDMKIFLWNVYGDCENFSVLTGHSGAIMQLHFTTDSSLVASASTDKTVRLWDMCSGGCARRLRGHTAIVNAVHPARRGPQLLVSGSDDTTIRVWDARQREPLHTLQNGYQVTAVSFNDTAEQIISGGIDNDIKVWDLRKLAQVYEMRGHTDTVTGLSLSAAGTHVLSNSMDCTARIWDIRPYADAVRLQKVFQGHQHNFEKNLLRCAWSGDGQRVSCGSADRYVYVWDVATRRIVYKLPGHQGSVNETAFHPIEPILLSAGSDKKIYLGEIQ